MAAQGAQGQTSYAATGASVGMAFGPVGAAVGAVVGLVADVVMQPAAPSSANGTFQNNLGFDNSGWNVAFAGATIDSDATSNNTQGGTQGSNTDPYGMAGMSGGSSADSMFGTSLGFDNSGWNVAFSGATIDSTASKTTSQGGAQKTGPDQQILGSNFSYAVLIVGAVVALKWLKR